MKNVPLVFLIALSISMSYGGGPGSGGDGGDVCRFLRFITKHILNGRRDKEIASYISQRVSSPKQQRLRKIWPKLKQYCNVNYVDTAEKKKKEDFKDACRWLLKNEEQLAKYINQEEIGARGRGGSGRGGEGSSSSSGGGGRMTNVIDLNEPAVVECPPLGIDLNDDPPEEE